MWIVSRLRELLFLQLLDRAWIMLALWMVEIVFRYLIAKSSLILFSLSEIFYEVCVWFAAMKKVICNRTMIYFCIIIWKILFDVMKCYVRSCFQIIFLRWCASNVADIILQVVVHNLPNRKGILFHLIFGKIGFRNVQVPSRPVHYAHFRVKMNYSCQNPQGCLEFMKSRCVLVFVSILKSWIILVIKTCRVDHENMYLGGLYLVLVLRWSYSQAIFCVYLFWEAWSYKRRRYIFDFALV